MTGYGLYRNARARKHGASTSSTFTGLTCGTSYSLAVDAVDAAEPLGEGDDHGEYDRLRRRYAGALRTGGLHRWHRDPDLHPHVLVGSDRQRCRDRVRHLHDRVLVTSTSSLSYSYTGLTCGTNYTLAVDAVDAAGNRSAKATVIAGSAACSTPPPSGSANLWVDTNGGSCARQASAGAYVDASACASFGAAYSAAQCGDTVGVRSGTYGTQNVSSGSKSCTSTTPVTITSVPGGTCTDNTTAQMPS